MAQVVEHVLGKDEVTSSNLVNSSRNPAEYSAGFFTVYPAFVFAGKCMQMQTAIAAAG